VRERERGEGEREREGGREGERERDPDCPEIRTTTDRKLRGIGKIQKSSFSAKLLKASLSLTVMAKYREREL